jgi:hypothetical protein
MENTKLSPSMQLMLGFITLSTSVLGFKGWDYLSYKQELREAHIVNHIQGDSIRLLQNEKLARDSLIFRLREENDMYRLLIQDMKQDIIKMLRQINTIEGRFQNHLPPTSSR